MGGGVGESPVELRRPDLDSVEERTAFEVERERNDRDAARARQLRGEVARRVGDDRRLRHCGLSSACWSLSRRWPRRLKMRSSSGLTANRMKTTTRVTKTESVK